MTITRATVVFALLAGCTEPAAPGATEVQANAPEAKSPVEAPKGSVRFAFPPDGAVTYPEVAVAMGVSELAVVPAGTDVDDATKGHHHLIIDGAPVPKGQVVPADATHLHYGKGQTETQVTLEPGKRTLTMQFADGAHRFYGPGLATTIKLDVKPAPAKAPRVFFVGLKDGAKVKSPLKLTFGLEGMKVRPAGEDPLDLTTGHHHIIVDGSPLSAGTIVPSNETNIHFGKGQTKTELPLKPGEHTLTLQLADGAHRSYGAKLSATVKVTVK